MVTLSRDHHLGLLFCWKIKEGLRKDIAISRIVKYVRYFWESHLRQHFSEEEVLLFNVLKSTLTAKAIEEHQVLGLQFAKIVSSADLSRDEYLELARQLIDHIRFEEREVFPHLEAELSADTLTCIGEILLTLHAESFEDNYPDEFWAADKKVGDKPAM